MHIKQVIISNFRSYKGTCEVDPFSRGHNVIVGRNGTGKSNFFRAIEFVLSDKFSFQRQEDRKNLLHEGTKSSCACVKIVFDNSDERLPINSKTVTLTRELSLKKDQYYLNGKRQQRGQINDLLESAGFSRSNPYYIVQQGKVQKLVSMKAAERLAILEEVAGTKVYEERRAESFKILVQTNVRRKQMHKVIENIEEKLKTLAEEKKGLVEYLVFDKKRRAVKYCIYNQMFENSRSMLNEIEREYKELNVGADNENEKKLKLENDARKTEAELGKVKKELAHLNAKKTNCEAEWSSIGKTREGALLEVKEREDARVEAGQKRVALQDERNSLEPEVRKQEQILKEYAPKIKKQETKRDKTDSLLRRKELEQSALEDKTGRAIQFKSTQERDNWLKSEIPQRQETSKRMTQNIKSKEASMKKLRQSVQMNKKNLKARKTKLSTSNKEATKVSNEKRLLETQKIKLMEKKKHQFRRGAEVDKEAESVRDAIQIAKEKIFHFCPRDIKNGLKRVQEIVDSEEIEGACGPLFDLFKCPNKKFHLAVEAVAHNSLFNYVVDTEELASKLIGQLKDQGRVTFMPLDRLRKGKLTSPKGEVRLVERLKYDAKYEDPIMQIFGKIIVCRDLRHASTVSKKFKMRCVTLSGELVEWRGGMDGGYWNPKRSRVTAVQARDDNQKKLVELEANQTKISETVADIDQSITKLLGDISILERDYSDREDKKGDWNAEIKALKICITDAEHETQRQADDLKTMRDRHGDLEAEIQTMQKEMGTELVTELSTQDRETLEQLKKDITRLTNKANKQRVDLEKLKADDITVRHHLSDNLKKRMFEIDQVLSSGMGSKADLEEKKQALEHAKASLAKCDAESEAAKKEIALLISQIADTHKRQQSAAADLEKDQTELQEVKDKLNEMLQDMERLTKRRKLREDKASNARREMLALGSVPLAEMKEYRTIKSRKTLDSELKRVQKEIKRLGHVNKKAMDQFINYNDQRNSLLSRVSDIEKSKLAIDKLIPVLDQRKDEAIQRTFKDVKAQFTTVFSELVPDGYGSLELLTKDDKYTGVNMKVSFTNKKNGDKVPDTVHLAKLSGGQRALVALALIFAIQRIDPAPFYLFDEIDQALDATHRKKVADLIQKQANHDRAPCQFITSTFRPECVEAANKCYGITFQHKISRAVALSKKQALDFIETTQNDKV